ncbi:hypothetical protein AB0G05_46545, partial [Nonomuraea wenchangensis]
MGIVMRRPALIIALLLGLAAPLAPATAAGAAALRLLIDDMPGVAAVLNVGDSIIQRKEGL